jgi:hypothetical protein
MPRDSPAAEFQQLKDHAVTATTLMQQRQKWQQQAEQRRLRKEVAAAYRQHRWQRSAKSQTDILQAEQRLTEYEEQQRRRQGAAGDALWEVYGDGQPSFWGYRLGKEIPEQQCISQVAAADGSTVSTRNAAGVAAAGDLLADFYDPAKGGLFRRHPTDAQQ